MPAAREDITTSTISPADDARIPIATPNGVAIENTKTSCLTSLKLSGKVLTSEMPNALAAAPLWITIASTMLSVLFIDVCSPRAMPSNVAWTERAIMRTKGVALQHCFLGAKYSWMLTS